MRLWQWLAAATVGLACSDSDRDSALDGDLDGGPGNGSACGDLACSDGLRVSLVAAGGVFAGGQYELRLDVDGQASGCRFRIGGDEATCGNDPPCVLEDDCGVEFQSAVLPHTLTIVLGAVPYVEVGLLREGQPIAGEGLAPGYTPYAPNGDDCPPVCQVASAQLGVP